MEKKPSEQANMLMSMAYLDQILPVSSTVEAVHEGQVCGPGLPKTLPTDVASPCVHCFQEAVAAYLYRIRISRVHACMCFIIIIIMYTHELTHA